MKKRLKNYRDVARQMPWKPMSIPETKVATRAICTRVARASTNMLTKVYS